MTNDDEMILCAGDRGFRNTIKTVREKFPTMRIYVVAWAHNAYHRLKDMQDDCIFFINLDPYIHYLQYSSEAIADVTCAPTAAGDDNRLVTTSEEERRNVREYLTREYQLLIDRDYSLSQPNRQGVLYVIFTRQHRDAGVVAACRERFPLPTRANNPPAHRARNDNLFAMLDDSDAEDDAMNDESDGFKYDDEYDDIDYLE